MQKIRPSKRYSLFKNISANNLGIFPKYDMLCNFYQIYDFTDRHCWLCFYHVLNMVFICFHISDNNLVLLTYLVRKLFYIIHYLL